MQYDSDFDIDIESRWWSLMNKALDKSLCIGLEKHLDSNNRRVLHVKICPIDRNPDILFSEYDSDYDTRLYYMAMDFVNNYSKEK